jgi:tetratricopeptide (TPR) repeat protein
LLSLLVCVLLAACANSPPPAPPPAASTPPSTLQDLMQRADASAKEGRRELSRLQYREAAKAYPNIAAPWSKLAEDYFESGDHGNAILAAQEVVQREPQNVVAQSVLTLSGLRVSNTALTALREQQSGVPGNTREQALALNRSLREALGETTLAPRIVDGTVGAPGSGSSSSGARGRAATSAKPTKPANPDAKTDSKADAKPAAKPAPKI